MITLTLKKAVISRYLFDVSHDAASGYLQLTEIPLGVFVGRVVFAWRMPCRPEVEHGARALITAVAGRN